VSVVVLNSFCSRMGRLGVPSLLEKSRASLSCVVCRKKRIKREVVYYGVSKFRFGGEQTKCILYARAKRGPADFRAKSHRGDVQR
jgi:hypothetical protein